MMTPEEFKLKMQTILTEHENYPETCHYEMDKLMCEVLSDLGYEEGVKVFEDTERWYS